MLERLNDYDWEEAFAYASGVSCAKGNDVPMPVEGAECSAEPFTREDVIDIIAIDEGENDGPSWVGLFLLSDGRFGFLEASCDYTGWD